MTLAIDEKDYRLTPLDPCEVRVGWRLTQPTLFDDGPMYEVWETEHGWHGCQCKDFEMRSGPAGRPCRHLVALYQTGLLTRFPPPGCGPSANLQPCKESLA